MFIVDFQTEKIREVDHFEICNFVNNLIWEQSEDLLGKRYLFIPTADAAEYVLTKSLENKNAKKH